MAAVTNGAGGNIAHTIAALQRGRRSMAAVTARVRAIAAPEAELASTGPPLDGGGDRSSYSRPSTTRSSLQRGRRSMAAVTPRNSLSIAILKFALQRGRRSMAAVTAPRRPGEGEVPAASTGPPLDGGGDCTAW